MDSVSERTLSVSVIHSLISQFALCFVTVAFTCNSRTLTDIVFVSILSMCPKRYNICFISDLFKHLYTLSSYLTVLSHS